MADEIANLKIGIDATEVIPAASNLDALTAAGARTEQQTNQVTYSAKQMATALAASGNDIAKATALLEAQGAAAGKSATAIVEAATVSSSAYTTLAEGCALAAGVTDTAFKSASASASVFAQSLKGQAAIAASAMEETAAVAVESSAVQIAANEAVVASHKVSSRAITESLVLLREAARGNYSRMAGSASILIQALGLLNAVLIPLAATAIVVGSAFEIATNQLNSGAQGTGDLTKGLGLSADQLDRVKDKYVSFMDTFKAFFQVIGEEIGASKLPGIWQETWDVIATFLENTLKIIIGDVIGAVRVIEEAWKALPEFMGGQGSIAGINFSKAFKSGLDDAEKGVDNFFGRVADKARENASNRILKEAGPFSSNNDGAVDSVDRMIQKLNDEAQAQKGLNDQVEHAEIDIVTYTDAQKLYQQTASEIARIEKDANLSAAEKQAWITKLILAQSGYNATLKEQQYIQATVANDNHLDVLNRQIALVGGNARAVAVAMAELRAQQDAVTQRFNPKQAEDYEKELVAIANATIDLKVKTDAYNESLHAQLDTINELASAANDAAQGLASSFGKVGTAIEGMTNALTTHSVAQAKFAVEQDHLNKLAADGHDITSQQTLLTLKQKDADEQFYSSTLDGVKNLFDSKSAAYKDIQAIEGAYNLWRLGENIVQMASDVAAGAARIFASLGPWGFPVVAAMIGVMAALGFGGGGGGAAPPVNTAKQNQDAQGSGSVLGDANAKSDSIAKSLDELVKDNNSDLDYSNQMVVSLRAIQDGIGSLTTLLARQLSVGGLFNTSGLNLGTSGGGVGSGIPLVGGLVSSLFGSSSSSTTLLDQGIQIAGTTIGAAVAQGVAANAYQTTQTQSHSSALFGLISSSSTTNKTKDTPLSSDFNSSIQGIIEGLRSTLLDAAGKLGIDGAQTVIDSMAVNLGTISLKDMTGTQIQDALNSVFGKLGDDLSTALVPQLSQFQQAGEGALQTLARLVNEYRAVDDAAKTVGFTFSLVGVNSLAARDALIKASGGLDQFVSQASFFASNFISASKQLAPIQASVTAELARLGVVGVTTKDQFATLVQSLDVSTDSGAQLYAALMAVAPAFAKVADATTALNDQRTDLEIKLLQDQGSAIAATALQRQKELAALDDSLKPLQAMIYAQEDANAAAAGLTAANDNLTKAQTALTSAQSAANQVTQQTINQFNGFATSLTAFQQTLFSGSAANNSATQQYNVAKSIFTSTAAAARNGDPVALGNLQQASSDFLTASSAASKTSVQYATDLAAVKGAVADGIKVSQTQADIATKQLYAINTVNNSVLSVADAVNNLAAAQAAYDALIPGHANGLNRVPYNGYLMRAHEGEAVLTKNQAADWRAGKGSGSNDNAELVAEIRELRKQMNDVITNTGNAARSLKNVAPDGDAIQTRAAA